MLLQGPDFFVLSSLLVKSNFIYQAIIRTKDHNTKILEKHFVLFNINNNITIYKIIVFKLY